MVHSPDKDTPTRELVEISQQLVDQVQGAHTNRPDPRIGMDDATEMKLLERIARAQKRFPPVSTSR